MEGADDSRDGSRVVAGRLSGQRHGSQARQKRNSERVLTHQYGPPQNPKDAMVVLKSRAEAPELKLP